MPTFALESDVIISLVKNADGSISVRARNVAGTTVGEVVRLLSDGRVQRFGSGAIGALGFSLALDNLVEVSNP